MPDIKPTPTVTETAAPTAVPFDMEAFAKAFASAMRGEGEAARLRDMDALAAQRQKEDEARASGEPIPLVAVVSWNEHGGVLPGATKTINPGDEILVAPIDLQKYAGKALPRAPEPLNGGVTISSAAPAPI